MVLKYYVGGVNLNVCYDNVIWILYKVKRMKFLYVCDGF